jgi:coenzyme F420-reducing hydrogenase gamma subunit
VRTLAEASFKDKPSIVVAFSSCAVGGRIVSHRPGKSCSVNVLSRASYSAGSVTSKARPNAITER